MEKVGSPVSSGVFLKYPYRVSNEANSSYYRFPSWDRRGSLCQTTRYELVLLDKYCPSTIEERRGFHPHQYRHHGGS